MFSSPEATTPASSAALETVPAQVPILVRLSALAMRHRALIGTVGVSFLVFALQALQGVLLARVLGPEGRGQYNTAVFYTHLLLFAGMLGIPFSIQRRAAKLAGGEGGLSTAASWAGLITGLVSAAVVAILAYAALPDEKQWLAPWCMLAALSLPLQHVRLALQSVDRGSENFLRYNLSEVVHWAGLPLLLAPLLWWGGASVETVVALTVISALAALLVRAGLGYREGFAWGARPRPQTLLREGMPYALAKVVSDLLNRLDSLLVLWLASFTIQGYYAAAVPAANMLAVAPAAFAMFAFNLGARGPSRSGVGRIAAASVLSVLVQLAAAAALALALPALIVLVFGPEFAGAVAFAVALLPAKAFAGLGLIAEGYLRGRGKPHIEFRCRLAGGAIMLLTVAATWPWLREFSIPLGALTGHAFPTLVMGFVVLWDARSSGANAGASGEADAAGR